MNEIVLTVSPGVFSYTKQEEDEKTYVEDR